MHVSSINKNISCAFCSGVQRVKLVKVDISELPVSDDVIIHSESAEVNAGRSWKANDAWHQTLSQVSNCQWNAQQQL